MLDKMHTISKSTGARAAGLCVCVCVRGRSRESEVGSSVCVAAAKFGRSQPTHGGVSE